MRFSAIQVKSYKEAFSKIKQLLDRRIVDLDKKHYIIVPDDCTLIAERLFFSEKGAFDAEVLTFNRLFFKLVEEENYLPRQGAVMLMKSVIKSLEKELQFFRRSATHSGFAQKVYQTIDTLIYSEIGPDDLDAGYEKVSKLKDIKLIYKKYSESLKGRFVDSSGRLRLLKKQAEETDFGNAVFYFAGFSALSKLQKSIIGAIEKTARGGFMFNVSSPQKAFGNVEFYCSPDEADQLKTAAKRIRALVKNGTRYKDIAIISPSLAFEKARRIFSEFDIPFFIDQKTILSEQSLARYFFSIQSILERGYRAEDFIVLSKNAFSKINKDDADEFENYCLKFCVDYKGFFSPFQIVGARRHEDAEAARERLDAAERVRKRLVDIVEFFDKERQNVKTAEGFCEFVAKVSERAIHASMQEDESGQAQKICAVAQLLPKVMLAGENSFNTMFELFCEGLKASSYSVLPKYSDVVVIGGCSAFRAETIKHMFVIDFCEGVIPPHNEDLELISDSEIDALKIAGIDLEPKVSEINESVANDFMFSVTETESVFLAYPENGVKKRSELYPCFLNAQSVVENCYADENEIFFELNDSAQYNADTIAAACSTKSNALEMLLVSAARAASGEKTLSFAAEINALFDDRAHEKFISYNDYAQALLSENGDLFFKNNATSISQMQEYFLCPFSAFMKYSLRLSEREDGRLSAQDIGSFLHLAAQKFIENGDLCEPSQSMRLLAEQIAEADEKYLLEANKTLIERLIEEAVLIAPILARQIVDGSFVPLYQEKRFSADSDNALKTVILKCGQMELGLNGVIDRIDVYENYARVIDYKTGNAGKTDFDFTELYFGRRLQLLVYLAVMRENGYIPAGGFYFPFSFSWGEDEFSHRLKGLYLSQPKIVTAMDRALLCEGVKSEIINAKRKTKKENILTEKSFCASSYALSAQQMDSLCDYALKVMGRAACEAADGYIAASPFEQACQFCSYTAVCRMAAQAKRRARASLKRDAIVKIMSGGNAFDE